jgi:ATP synthase protein I
MVPPLSHGISINPGEGRCFVSHDSPPPSLEELDARLREARQKVGLDKPESQDGVSAASGGDMALGVRIGVELVAGVLLGLALGYGLDFWLGTKPIGMIVMIFVGAIAGFMNVYRVVNGHGYAAGFVKSRDERDGGE